MRWLDAVKKWQTNMCLEFGHSYVGQDAILPRIGNPPGAGPGTKYGPIANRPQVTNLPHSYKITKWLWPNMKSVECPKSRHRHFLPVWLLDRFFHSFLLNIAAFTEIGR